MLNFRKENIYHLPQYNQKALQKMALWLGHAVFPELLARPCFRSVRLGDQKNAEDQAAVSSAVTRSIRFSLTGLHSVHIDYFVNSLEFYGKSCNPQFYFSLTNRYAFILFLADGSSQSSGASMKRSQNRFSCFIPSLGVKMLFYYSGIWGCPRGLCRTEVTFCYPDLLRVSPASAG